ncbi:MAG: DUF1015 domain-containing protein [Tenacibaculum sp.]|nr:DUF1015 domain-containing protein [Tenacibaculum sp.]
MAIVKPFKAVRTTKDKVALVSYKESRLYSKTIIQEKLKYNPFTFLHVLNTINNKNVSLEKQFELIRNRYLEFKENKILIQDNEPYFYIYKKITPTSEYCGIIAGTSVKDYENNIIKKHEDTIKKQEVLFEDYLRNTGFNSDPVLITYPDDKLINSVIQKHQKEQPEYEFTSADKSTHLVWIIKDIDEIKSIQLAFKNIKSLYIADGHHRCASITSLAKKMKGKDNNSYDFILSCLIPESNLKFSEFNRFVRDLNGLSKNEFLTKLNEVFTVKNYGQEYFKPLKKHQFSMYLNGEFYSLSLKEEKYTFSDSLSKLDTEILNRTILSPILGIKNIRNDSRIAYFSNKKNNLSLKNKVDNGKFKISFGMMPVDINEMKKIADEGLKMPPKSTYIEPKLRSALTIYEF